MKTLYTVFIKQQMKEEGSSATDSVTDVTDVTNVRQKAEERGKKVDC
ncbi:hypothetical protein [Microcoleus sp. Pol14C2]